MRSLVAFSLATLLSGAAVAEQVNVYSYRQPDLIRPLTDAFTKSTGIDVKVVFLKKGLLERLQAEGDRTPADLILTTDISRLAELVRAGVTKTVTSEILTANIPAEMRDPAGHWFGLTARARVIYASTERVGDGEVTTYEALADPKWRDRICTRSGAHAYNLALTSAMIVHHGTDKTRDWLNGLKANLARRPQGNDRAQVKAIWAGECDIAIGNTYYMAAMLAKPEQRPWADAVGIVFPRFSNGGTHMNISGMAMTRSGPNAANALKLMEFLASAEGQKIYAEIVAEYPALEGVAASDLVAGWGGFERDTIGLIDIAEQRAAAVRLVEETGFDN